MPPVINVKKENEVFEGLKKVYFDSDWRKQLETAGLAWYRKYHSNNNINESLITVYGKVIDG